jgi:hypothetical protein
MLCQMQQHCMPTPLSTLGVVCCDVVVHAGDDGRPGGATLRQIRVPRDLVGQPYSALVRRLLASPRPQERAVPLGLLRRKAENRAWRLPYVATHPSPDTLLQLGDAVFIVRPQ